MTIEKTEHEDGLIITLSGRLDSTGAGSLEAFLDQELREGLQSLTIDLKDVDFVSSRGLRVLVSAYKKMNGREMVLSHANSSVLEVLRLSGLLKIFKIASPEQ